MHALAMLFLLALPFWEAKGPHDWTTEELREMFSGSPWVRVASYETSVGAAPSVTVYLATARPMRDAEAELERRTRRARAEPGAPEEEYREFLSQNEGKIIVLAVRLPKGTQLKDGVETTKLEEECILKIGKKKHKMVGHFPPTESDPYLRLVYPRAVEPADKELTFELYLPMVPSPFRLVQFTMNELVYRGKPEF